MQLYNLETYSVDLNIQVFFNRGISRFHILSKKKKN